MFIKGLGASSASLTTVVMAVCIAASVMTSPAPIGKSHVRMWMVTEKQLVPRIAWLAQTAYDLLNYACTYENKTLTPDDCRAFADSLPGIKGVDVVPSEKTLKDEKKKKFVKVLVLDGYKSLTELRGLLDNNVLNALCEDTESCVCHKISHFNSSLRGATDQYKDLVTSFYKAKPAETRTKEVQVGKQFATNMQLIIKVLSIAEDRLREIMSVLEYSVELSWFSRMNVNMSAGRKVKGRGNRKTRS